MEMFDYCLIIDCLGEYIFGTVWFIQFKFCLELSKQKCGFFFLNTIRFTQGYILFDKADSAQSSFSTVFSFSK